jgi:uncharacterized protein HemY
MIRILIISLAALLLVGLATALVGLEGKISGELFGARFDAPSGVVVLTALAVLALVAMATSLLKDLMRWPSMLRTKSAAKKGARGMGALSRSYAMLAAGDAHAALKTLAKADKTVADRPLFHLIKAEAHAAAGEDDLARSAYDALASTPDFEGAALRGLARIAQRSGDDDALRPLLDRAAADTHHAAWVFDAAFAEDLAQADWAAARARLAAARREGIVDKARSNHTEALLLAAEAQRHRRMGDLAGAISCLDEALALDPDFDLATIERARCRAEAGNVASDRRGRNPGTDQSARSMRLENARALIAAHDAPAALALLRDALDEHPDREALTLAAIASAASGATAAAEQFLEAAMLAPSSDLRALSPTAFAGLVSAALSGSAQRPVVAAEEARPLARRGFDLLDRHQASQRGALALPQEMQSAPDDEAEARRKDAELARAADAARGVN